MSALPTIHDVARVAGVSRQTVSNVLNSPGIVRPDTRERVVSAIAELGYRPHESARRLRTRKSSTIGIRIDPMTDGISGSVLDRFLHALTEQAAALGLRVMLFTATDPDDEIRQFARLRDGADVDAFVLTSTFHGDPRTEWLIANHQSFVTFGRPWGIDDMSDPEHLWVDVDGWSGLHEATLALLDAAAGHLAAPGAGSRPSRDHSPTSPTVHPVPAGERVGYIGWPSGSGTGDDRRRGWRDAMHERSGLDPAGIDALARGVEDGVSSGGEALRSLLRAPGGVDAVVCASDSLALGALIAGGSRIPVIGYDNTPVAAALGLSSVEQPLDEVAAGVLELLTGTHRGRVDAPRAAAPASAGPQAPSDDPRHRLVRPRLILRTPESIPTP